jgi:hypothetical protein
MLAFFEALPPCLVGVEACASSHCWARELTKLGHQVRLMPATAFTRVHPVNPRTGKLFVHFGQDLAARGDPRSL